MGLSVNAVSENRVTAQKQIGFDRNARVLPGVNVKTAPDDFYPVERERLARFNGKSWELFGKVYGR